jgi:adenylate kinase family enzyme
MDPTILPKRFAEYREKTEPTIEFLRQKLGDKFFAIDGRPTIEDVYSNIMKILTNN